MRAEELRVGNWVECVLSDKYVKIEGISKAGKSFDGFYYIEYDNGSRTALNDFDECEYVKGISLTSELLIKGGFLKWNAPSNNLHISAWQSPQGARFDIDWIDGKLYLKSRYDQENLPAQWMPQIRYVHQLQNLCFALSNSEFKIELYNSELKIEL